MFFSKKGPPPGSVVGTIYSQGSLEAALRLSPGEVDFLEVRVDEFASKAARLEKALAGLCAPLIVTVRHPLEGGAGKLPAAQRRELFERFLPHAALIDVELRSAAALGAVIDAARAQKTGVILSHHDFRRTPALEKLTALREMAAEAGATVFKVAAVAQAPTEAARLLGFLTSPGPRGLKLAVMGMGRYGKMSRLALGFAGSVLNYGYLAEPQVSGQWPAVVLKQRLKELER
jgi:3-dehydroquinate dehydratase I